MSEQVLVIIGSKEWQAILASSYRELTQGLGGLPELPENMGMLFDIGYERYISVTTVPMLFPIDIAFLSDDLVVNGIYREIAPGHLITSSYPARYFFETNIGELSGIEVGDMASLTLFPAYQVPQVTANELSSITSLGVLMVLSGFVFILVKKYAEGVNTA